MKQPVGPTWKRRHAGASWHSAAGWVWHCAAGLTQGLHAMQQLSCTAVLLTHAPMPDLAPSLPPSSIPGTTELLSPHPGSSGRTS